MGRVAGMTDKEMGKITQEECCLLNGVGGSVILEISPSVTDLDGSRKLWSPEFVTTAQDGGRLSVLRTGRLNPQEILVIFSVRF